MCVGVGVCVCIHIYVLVGACGRNESQQVFLSSCELVSLGPCIYQPCRREVNTVMHSKIQILGIIQK